MSKLGEIVARRRRELGLSQDAVAKRMKDAGVPVYRGTISHIERGHVHTPTPAVLNQLAAVLEIPPITLLAETRYSLPDDEVDVGRLASLYALLDSRRRVELIFLAEALLRAQHADEEVPQGAPGDDPVPLADSPIRDEPID